MDFRVTSLCKFKSRFLCKTLYSDRQTIMSLSQNIIKFNSHTTSRDKFYRTFQYGARLLSWYLEKGGDKAFVMKLRRLEAALSLSRKLFRMGSSMDLVYKTRDSLAILDNQLMVASVSGNFFKTIWLLLDHCLWFAKIGVLQINQSVWGKWAMRAWLVALVASTVADLRKLHFIHKRMEGKGGSTTPQLQTELHNAQLNFYKDFCDTFIPLSGLGYINPGVGAVCGVISSIYGFHQEWEKHITPYKPK